MDYPRQLLLFNGGSQQASWNERMTPGEYAVHYSSFEGSSNVVPYCTVFGDLKAAEEYAREQVARRPDLRCTIYDHQGLVGAPLRDVRGSEFKGDSDLSPRFRRWGGLVLFFGGLALVIVDWSVDFRLTWPGTVGSRMLIPGLILLLTDVVFVVNARLARRRAGGGETT
jgi:hypothetical protein